MGDRDDDGDDRDQEGTVVAGLLYEVGREDVGRDRVEEEDARGDRQEGQGDLDREEGSCDRAQQFLGRQLHRPRTGLLF